MAKPLTPDVTEFVLKRNLLKNPTNILDPSWIKYKCEVIPNLEITPCKKRNGDKIVEDNTFGIHGIIGKFDNDINKPRNQIYSGIAYLKLAEREFCRYYLADGQQISCVTGMVNLHNGDITQINGVGFNKHAYSTIYIGDGWWKLKVSASIDRARQGVSWMLQIAQTRYEYKYDGDGESGIYAWGVQLIKNT